MQLSSEDSAQSSSFLPLITQDNGLFTRADETFDPLEESREPRAKRTCLWSRGMRLQRPRVASEFIHVPPQPPVFTREQLKSAVRDPLFQFTRADDTFKPQPYNPRKRGIHSLRNSHFKPSASAGPAIVPSASPNPLATTKFQANNDLSADTRLLPCLANGFYERAAQIERLRSSLDSPSLPPTPPTPDLMFCSTADSPSTAGYDHALSVSLGMSPLDMLEAASSCTKIDTRKSAPL
ncbi:hypothetical protein BC834DRAFT_968143 [Gloeopeniophorella convolvens]|nr:hypothetical protein BC834DRAFT_968143 [Gloeopeniophorella convolvens]